MGEAADMGDKPKYLLVDEKVLPDIFPKIIEVKRLLSKGHLKSVNEAVQSVGISRSAYYKYRDFVFPFHETTSGRVVTLYFIVEDFSGILSNIIAAIAKVKANILTINQNIPINGLADITISMETHEMTVDIEELLADIMLIEGVRKQGILSRE